MTASTNAPIYFGAAFFADELVAILLGDGWEASAQILQVLAIWGALRSIGNPLGSLLLGLGLADLSLKWNLGLLIIVPPVVWFGSMYGPQGIALALLALSVVLFVPGWFVLVRPLCHARFFEYAIMTLRPMGIALMATIPAYTVAGLVEGAFYRLVIGVVVAAPLYLLLAYWLNRSWVHSLWDLVGGQRALTVIRAH